MTAWDDLFGDQPDYIQSSTLLECHDLVLDTNQRVMGVGDEDPALIYLLEGEVSIRRNGIEIDVSGPGEVIGEMALFRSTPRVAEVVTKSPTRALIVTRAAYEKLVEDNNAVVFRLERKILTQLGARLRRLDKLVAVNSEGQDNPYMPPPKGFLARIREAIGKAPEVEVVEHVLDAAKVLGKSHLFRNERPDLVECDDVERVRHGDRQHAGVVVQG